MAMRAGEAAIGAGVAPRDPSSLEALAAAARERGPGAFDELARRLAPRVMAYADGIVRDRGLAEEAVQETLIRVYRFLPRYAEGNFLAWTLTIATRVCMNLVRRERRHAALVAVVKPFASADTAPASDSRLALERAIAELPTPFAQVFLLHHQGLSYAEIGDALGVAVGTVRSRLSRAREALRAAMLAAGERTQP